MKYTVKNGRLRYGKKLYSPGDPVEMKPDEAKRLLARGVIEPQKTAEPEKTKTGGKVKEE